MRESSPFFHEFRDPSLLHTFRATASRTVDENARQTNDGASSYSRARDIVTESYQDHPADEGCHRHPGSDPHPPLGLAGVGTHHSRLKPSSMP